MEGRELCGGEGGEGKEDLEIGEDWGIRGGDPGFGCGTDAS